MRFIYRAAVWSALALPGIAAAELTVTQWQQDLQVLAAELPRLHKNLFFQQPKAEFERQVRELDAAIPMMSDLEIRAALVRLLSSVGNAHTTINALQGTPYFPLAVQLFAEGIYVTAPAPERRDLLGARLLAINGMGMDEVRRRVAPYIAKENDVTELVNFPPMVRNAAVLKAAGVISALDRAEFTVERGGVQSKLELESGPRLVMAGGPEPTKRRNLDYWFEYLPESETMYVQYNSCREMQQQSFAQFTAAVMEAASKEKVQRYVVDLRFNGGGNSRVVEPLVKALQSRKIKLFVLVGRNTFSSGYLAAMDLRTHAHGVLVGEAMGQRPNSYGDIRPLKLPNSGLTAFYCTKFFQLSKQDVPQQEPDVPVLYRAADYFGGKDPAMQYAVTH